MKIKKKTTSNNNKIEKSRDKEAKLKVANNRAIVYLIPVYLFIFLTTNCAVPVFLDFTTRES